MVRVKETKEIDPDKTEDIGLNYEVNLEIQQQGTVTITFVSSQFIPPELSQYITNQTTLPNGQVVVTFSFPFPIEIEHLTGVVSINSNVEIEVEKKISLPIPSKIEVKPAAFPSNSFIAFNQTFGAGTTNISPPTGAPTHAHSFIYLKNNSDAPIYVGDSASQPLQIEPGQSILFPLNGELDVTTIYITSIIPGQIIVAYK